MLGGLVLTGASLVLLVVAAKAHGRQVRLAREAAGVHEVTFGGDNPPLVIALWTADRRRYWTFAPAFAVLFGAILLLGGARWPGVLLAATLWAMTAAFAAAGLAVAGPTLRANAGWWAAAAAAAAGVAVLAVTLP